MAIIEGTGPNGAGTNQMHVNTEGEATVFAVTEEELEHVSEHDGLAFNWSSGTVDIDAADTVLLVKNTSTTHELHIETIEIDNGSVASEYDIHVPTTEVTPTGTTVTGFNLNTARSEVAEASAKSDETNNTQGTIIATRYMSVDENTSVDVRGLILGTNKSVAVDVVANTSESAVTIIGLYKLK